MNKLWTGIRIALCVGLVLMLGETAFGQGNKIQVQWLGQSATKITTPSGKVIVIDPFLINNPKTPMEYKKLEALGKVDLILVTHAHGDHFADAPALSKLNNAPVYGPSSLNQALVTRDLLKPKFAIPVHYGTYPVLKGTPEEYIKALGTTSTKVMVLNPGDKVEF